METSTEKILLNENLGAQSNLRSDVRVIVSHLSSLVGAYANLWEGKAVPDAVRYFQKSDIDGVATAKLSSNCQSCRGLRAYNSITNYLLDRLMDNMPPATLGGVELSREAVKPLIMDKLPDKSLIEKFEQAYNRFKAGQYTYKVGYKYVAIQDNKVVVLEEQLDQYCRGMAIYAETPSELALLDALNKFIEHAQSLNETLAGYGKESIKFAEDSLVFKPKGEGIRVNKRKLSKLI